LRSGAWFCNEAYDVTMTIKRLALGVSGLLAIGAAVNHLKQFGALAVALCAVLCGCAKYQYQLLEPAQFAQTIGREEVSIDRDSVQYRLREYDRRQSMRIANSGDDPITLLGERSYIVDPNGESHPMRGVTIAPGSYIGLVLPPLAPVYRTGPRFGVGVGVGTSFMCRSPSSNLHELIDPEGPYWRWKEGEVRMQLTFEQGPSEHHFTFVRRRMD
jgi:hypothetical protein